MTPFKISDFTQEIVNKLPQPPSPTGFFTMVGSRKTPETIIRVMEVLAAILFSRGLIGRSGGAEKADEAFEHGMLAHPHYAKRYPPQNPPMEIYLPWNGFEAVPGSGVKKWEDIPAGYINAKKLAGYEQAQQICLRIHPNPEVLRNKQGVYALHTRNVFQLLGMELKHPSIAVYLWAPPSKDGTVTGGTRTAVALAMEYKVPCMNLANDATLAMVLSFIEKQYHALMQG